MQEKAMSVIATDQYMEKMGVVCSSMELAHILTLARLPPSPGEVPSTEVIIAIDTAAFRNGLPRLPHGHYGLDLSSGEFIKSV
jgi:hypothetical protein